MEQAVEEAVSRLKEKHPALVEFILLGRENYCREVEREGFFHIDRLKGEFSQPLKMSSEIDLDSLVAFFPEQEAC